MPMALEAHRIASMRNLQFPQWSPDGRWLAYTAGSLFDTYQLNLMDPEGKHQRRVTSFPAGFIFCVAWLPDSRHLVFRTPPSAPIPPTCSRYLLTRVRFSRLTLFPRGVFTSCSVSADGKRLVGTTDEQDWEIWKAPLGSDPKANAEAAVRLLDHAWQPMWIASFHGPACCCSTAQLQASAIFGSCRWPALAIRGRSRFSPLATLRTRHSRQTVRVWLTFRPSPAMDKSGYPTPIAPEPGN